MPLPPRTQGVNLSRQRLRAYTRPMENLALRADFDAIARDLAGDEDLCFAILFGSVATGRAGSASDLDVAVFATEPLSAERKIALIARLAELTGRPVDLLDLRTAGVLVTREALTKGRLLFCRDRRAYGELAARMVTDAADFLPYVERLLRERRSAWIG